MPVVKGLLTFVPGIWSIAPKRRTGGTNSASYCYEVWLKHLTMLWASGLRSIPRTLAELGPGDSLGIGLAAMLSGVDCYYALDVERFSSTETNLEIFDELVGLFGARAGRPAQSWPDYDEYLDENLFPSHILTPDVLGRSLSEERIRLIRRALVDEGSAGDAVTIGYIMPWSDETVISEGTVDVALSHAVLEHVADLERAYRILHAWLKPGGMMSHQIDFTSHALTDKWNGYRMFSERAWKMIAGRRPFFINREPCSVHVDLMENNGFDIICQLKMHRTDGIERSQLSRRWKNISDDDFTCSGMFIQAQKRRP